MLPSRHAGSQHMLLGRLNMALPRVTSYDWQKPVAFFLLWHYHVTSLVCIPVFAVSLSSLVAQVPLHMCQQSAAALF